MKLYAHRLLTLCLVALSLAGCARSPQEQVEEYMRFYYPATSENFYDITFDWGRYEIITSDPIGSEVHPDSQPYLGYITMRPHVTGPSGDFKPAIYLITPEGAVWSIAGDADIAMEKSRDEVTVEESTHGTATTTITHNAPNEPIIDHFKGNPSMWQKYGTLKAVEGGSAELTRAK